MNSFLTPNPELYALPYECESFNGMPYLHLGNSGCRVSKVGLGAWKYGYPETGDGARVDKQTAFKIFDRAIELGITFWDTAARYNNSSGNSERVIGEWFKSNPDQRRNVIVATKFYGLMDGSTPNHWQLGRNNIMDSTYACLQRLQIEHIDVMYFHHYDPKTPIEESLKAINDLMSRDLVRYFAVSNFTADNLKLYDEFVGKEYPRILAVQNGFNILEGEVVSLDGEKQRGQSVLDYCYKTDKSFIAWGPLGQGMLTNRYLDLSKVGKGDRLYDDKFLEKKLTPEKHKKLKALAVLADKWGVEVNQLALAYTLTLPGMGSVIPSSSTIEQLESNAGAGTIELSKDQLEKIKKTLS